MASHQALTIASKDSFSHSLVSRPTPQPGPGELAIRVKAVALNHIDYAQRDMGFPPISAYPTVLGFDVAGIVSAIGPDVDVPFPIAISTSRVIAHASGWFHHSNPNYGAFQEYVLVNADKVTPLPESISFAQGATLPMSVSVAMSAWWLIGVAPPTSTLSSSSAQQKEEEEKKKKKKKGILVWSATTSVGSAAVQTAKILGYRVYATTMPTDYEYVQKTLGADRVFDYESATVVAEIVQAITEDGVSVHQCFLGRGELEPISAILTAVREDPKQVATIVSAPIVPPDADRKVASGIAVKFIIAPQDPIEASKYFRWVFNGFLREKLATGEYVPSPYVKIVGKGLEAVDRGLEELKKGVNATKLVVEL